VGFKLNVMLRTGVSLRRIRTCAGSVAFAVGPALGGYSLSESSFVPVAVFGRFTEIALVRSAVCGLLVPVIMSSKLFANES
jgi:hypothetical protein